MPEPSWDDVKKSFDVDLNGTLPDAVVSGTTVADWQAVLTLIRSRGWSNEYTVDSRRRPMPVSAMEVFASSDVLLKVWPVPGMLVNFWPMSAESVDFDVDLRELQGQARLKDLCHFLGTIGLALGKPVVLADEGRQGRAFLEYQVEFDRVVYVG
jgi:hypothetical protein